jgi:hypothetical protein
MPLRTDPATAAADWATRLGQSTDKINRGIQRVQQAPGAKAAAQADVWASNTAAAKEKFRRNVGRVSLGDWQAATQAAVGRVAEGAARKQGKFQAAITPVFAHMANVLASVDNMPRGSFEQNLARMNAMARGMHQYQSPSGGA